MADLAKGGRDDRQMKSAPVTAIIEEAAAPHRRRGRALVVRVNGAAADEGQPLLARSPELVHGLRNLIQNAVDFARSTVWIDVDHDERELRIAVGDDGPGFDADILPRLGEPYVSTRSRTEPRDASQGEADGYEGMGLGLFIARTLLERTGARLAFANGSDERQRRTRVPGTGHDLDHPPGAIIEIVWPADVLVMPKAVARRALGRNQRFAAES
jgi:two-component system sensor histidine kinase RegB